MAARMRVRQRRGHTAVGTLNRARVPARTGRKKSNTPE